MCPVIGLGSGGIMKNKKTQLLFSLNLQDKKQKLRLQLQLQAKDSQAKNLRCKILQI
jgi:hypothetical protein